jgi:hypothetical protein
MAEYATAADLKKHWAGIPAEISDEEIEQSLDEAELIVLAEYPDVPAWIASGRLSPDVVKLVLNRMARRALRPVNETAEQLESLSRGAGPFTSTLNFRGPVEDGELYMKKSERRLITGAASKSSGEAFTIYPFSSRG